MKIKPNAYIIEVTEDDHKEILFHFFMWFRENGEKYINISIEKMIEIYLKSLIN